jgi:molybdopterin molybdotransferase
MLSYQQAREIVIERVCGVALARAVETVPLPQALMRVLAQGIRSDRDYPPFDRSIRDGYAVNATDTSAGKTLKVIGELKAGDSPTISVAPGTCIQIMTGAPLPGGANAVVMIEHTSRDGNIVRLDRAVKPGQHVVPRGSEQSAGKTVLAAGSRFGFAEIAAAAQVGAAQVSVYRKPRIAILSTGDEVVDFIATPGPFQIRNSNSVSLAAQVSLSGGEPVVLGNAKDSLEHLRSKISAGLEADALLLSGGVSMGKYDLVEPVLREFEAEMIFDAVAIRPGKPVVFAVCKGKPVFGLPGNPVSTMVTCELFVRPAIDILSGTDAHPLAFVEAVLTERLSEKPGLAHFLPARLTWTAEAPHVSPIPWQGSGDVVAMAHANCLLVVPSNRETMEGGERVQVLPRVDVL